MLLGILCGIGINYSLWFANFAEIIYIVYGIIQIIKEKKLIVSKEFKKYIICNIVLIVYMLVYFFIDICDTSNVTKNIFKYLDVLILAIVAFQHCNKNEKKFIQFLIAFFTTRFVTFFAYNINQMDVVHVLHYAKFLIIIYIIMTLFEKNNVIKNILCVIAIILSLYSRSRTSLMIILVTIIYRLYQDVITKSNNKKQIIKKMFIIIVIGVVGIIGINYFIDNLSQETESNNERMLLIETAIKEITQNPFTGVGPGNFNLYAQTELGVKFKSDDLTVHNYYLEILTELGFIGFVIIFIYYIDIIKQLIKRNYNMTYKNIYVYLLVFQFFNTSSGDQRIETALILGLIFYDIASSLNNEKDNNSYENEIIAQKGKNNYDEQCNYNFKL